MNRILKGIRSPHVFIVTALLVAGVVALIVFTSVVSQRPRTAAIHHSRPPAVARPSATPEAPYVEPTAAQIAALPEAKYNAVIAGLLPYSTPALAPELDRVYTVTADTAIYGADRSVPVARFAAKNFLNESSVIVAVDVDRYWALVLTPAREQLPSRHVAGTAPVPAQTVGWMRRSALIEDHLATDRVVISVSAQTLRIEDHSGHVVQSFAVGVGTPGTPTPQNVTGYIEARYLDPSQGEAVYPIQLTSLHATGADNPYLGNDGGLIGIHYNTVTSGKVSHGCVRLNAAAITAVNKLPLGTIVSIEP